MADVDTRGFAEELRELATRFERLAKSEDMTTDDARIWLQSLQADGGDIVIRMAAAGVLAWDIEIPERQVSLLDRQRLSDLQALWVAFSLVAAKHPGMPKNPSQFQMGGGGSIGRGTRWRPKADAYAVICRKTADILSLEAKTVPPKSEEPVPPDDDEPEDPHERILEPLGPSLREIVEYLLKKRKMQARASVFCEKPFNENRQPSSIVQYAPRITKAWAAKGILDWSISCNVLRSENDHMIQLEPPATYKPPYK